MARTPAETAYPCIRHARTVLERFEERSATSARSAAEKSNCTFNVRIPGRSDFLDTVCHVAQSFCGHDDHRSIGQEGYSMTGQFRLATIADHNATLKKNSAATYPGCGPS